MLRYLPLLAALAACNAPDTFVLAAIATGDAAPTDVSSDAVGDAPADTARPDAQSDTDAGDASEATADATDAQVADVAGDTAQADASADVALADASDATGDASVSDAEDAPEASVDEICARATDCASCTAIRFDAVYGCGWCGATGQCVYGTDMVSIRRGCGGAWVGVGLVCP